MTNAIRQNGRKVAITLSICAVLIILGTCSWAFYTFEYGYPLNLTEDDFIVNDPNNKYEIAQTLIYSIAFDRPEGIKPFIDPYQWDKLDQTIQRQEQANENCRHPFDPVLGIGGSSADEEWVSIHLECDNRIYHFSLVVEFELNDNGQFVIVGWRDLHTKAVPSNRLIVAMSNNYGRFPSTSSSKFNNPYRSLIKI